MLWNVVFLHPHLSRAPEGELPLHGRAVFGARVECFQDFGRELHATLSLHFDPGRSFQQIQFAAQLRCFVEPNPFVAAILDQILMRSYGDFVFENNSRKERLQLVKVSLQQWIKFVIVTLGTSDRQSQKCGTNVARQIIKRHLPCQENIRSIAFIRPHPTVARCSQRFCIIRKKFIPGKLIKHESIKRKVPVVSPNHVVAIRVSRRANRVLFKSGRFCKTDNIEPVSTPGFAIMRVTQQPIDNPIEGVGTRVCEKFSNLFRSRR